MSRRTPLRLVHAEPGPAHKITVTAVRPDPGENADAAARPGAGAGAGIAADRDSTEEGA
jgi:hypothetical protein